MSGPVDVDVAAGGRGDGGQVAFVGADDEVAAPQGAFDDVGAGDVAGAGAAGEGPGGPGPGVIDTTAAQRYDSQKAAAKPGVP